MARPRENERTFDDLLQEDLKTRNYKPVYVFDIHMQGDKETVFFDV